MGGFYNGTANPAGGPSIYGANFQAINWAQSHTGYLDASGTPNKSLEDAFQRADARLGTFISDLKAAGKLHSTLVMVGAKQGQGPVDPSTLKISDPQTIIDGAKVPVAFFVGEDGGVVSLPILTCLWGTLCIFTHIFPLQMWLQNSTDAQTAKQNLLANNTLGVAFVLAGDEVTAAGFGSPYLDSRVPDLVIGSKAGVLWNQGFTFEDHGGFLPQDLNVPLFAYNPGLDAKNITEVVSNQQVASTMLRAVGLPLAQLDAYRLGDSPVLPELFD